MQLLPTDSTWSTVNSLKPLSGRAPANLFVSTFKTSTLRIAWRPISGSVPLNKLKLRWKATTVRIAWSPIPGSAPSKWLCWMKQ
eukprot:915494-Amphidinium_carterae.1